MAAERNAVIELFWRIHPHLYRWSGGRIGGRMMGMPVLLLTTRGRKSGQPRTRALMYLPQGNDFVVIASNMGAPHHPLWWRNLEADPYATITIGSTEVAVRAQEVKGEERDSLWRAAADKMSDYDEYQARTTRRIPVVLLERR